MGTGSRGRAKLRALENGQCAGAAGMPGAARKGEMEREDAAKFPSHTLQILSMPLAKRKKKKKKKSLVPPPPICNFLALIITKCGGICLCTCDGCQQHWKAVTGRKRRKKPPLCFLEQSSVEHFRCSLSDYCCSASNLPFPLN